MTDAPLLTLTDRALARLRSLGEGNGLELEAFELMEKTEEVCQVEGLLRLVPDIDIKSRQFPGAAVRRKEKDKEFQILPSFGALKEEVERRKKDFMESRDWFPEALKELREESGHGWGQDGGKIAFADRGAILAATEKCPACGGNGKITCQQCQGRTLVQCNYCFGRKVEQPCYHCLGKGTEPQNPGQVCSICRGTLFAPCRYCRATGEIPCPVCQGTGGTACEACQGKGAMTQEVAIETHVKLAFAVQKSSHLPSGLLRSLDRIGMANLPRGHGDIELIEPDKDDPDAAKNGIALRARIPYADIKLRFGGKVVLAAAFGKKGLLSGLPAFLDLSLAPWREALAKAAAGKGALDAALKARAMREALGLKLRGKGLPAELRRIYPLGLSQQTAEEIMNNMEQALRNMTLRARVTAAALSLLLSADVFAGYFLSPLHAELARGVPPRLVLILDALLPVLCMGLGGFGLAHASKWALKRRFPQDDVNLSQSIGKIGYAALAGILAVYGLIVAFTKFM